MKLTPDAEGRKLAPIEQCYTPEEVADILRIHKDTARKTFRKIPGVILIRNGRLQKHALVRIPHSVLDRYMRENRVA